VRATSAPRAYSDAQVANRDLREFGWEIAHATPAGLPLHGGTSSRGNAHDVGVWDLSIVQGPFSITPYQTLKLRFATFASRRAPSLGGEPEYCPTSLC
jgi:hypothetical protein